jgi:L-amino acid N-acyltransferase YncA
VTAPEAGGGAVVAFAPLRRADERAVRDIYNYYVVHSTATYHHTPLSLRRIREHFGLSRPATRAFCIREADGRTLGFCLLRPWSEKEGYRPTGEVTVYCAPDACGRGLGTRALAVLEEEARRAGWHTLIGGVCAENTASCRLFEKCGYVRCAELKEVGFKFGRRLDTVYFQKIFTDSRQGIG